MNKQQGIVWAPLLIIIGTLVLVGVVAYAVVQTSNLNKSRNSNTANVAVVNRNSNSNANTNRSVNTNAIVNINGGTNINASTVPADWKTYTNTQYGFSFQHPSDIIVTEGTTQMGSTVLLHLTFTQAGQTLGYWFNASAAAGYADPLTAFIQVQGFSDLSSVIVRGADLSVGGETAVHYCSVPGNISYCSAFLLKNNNLYLFEYREPATLPTEILSTLRFTAPTVAVPSDWLTYTNATYGYSIQYSPEYTPSGSPESYRFRKGLLQGDPTETFTVSALTEADRQAEGATHWGWYEWALNGFPLNDNGQSNTEPRFSGNHQVTYGTNTYMVFNDDVFGTNNLTYFLVRDGTVYAIDDWRVGTFSESIVQAMLASFTVL